MFPAFVSFRFLAVSHAYEGKRCFVSFSFPISFPTDGLRFLFPAYIRATGNEAVFPQSESVNILNI
jgi:hypothetical protein